MSATTDAAAFCAGEVRAHDFDRYAATLFVAPAKRRALLALYAFNSEIERIPAQITQPLPGEIRLQWWRDLMEGREHGGAEGNPVAAELLQAIAAHDLLVAQLTQLIEAHQFDLYNDPMPTTAALESYLGETNAALFTLAAQILGAPADTVAHVAHHAGLAQGLAGVIAALPRHAARRQLFLPQQLLEQHGCNIEDVFAGKAVPQVVAARDALIADTRDHLDTAVRLLADVPANARAAFLPLALVSGDLDMLAGANDPFLVEPRSRLRTLWTLWRAARGQLFR